MKRFSHSKTFFGLSVLCGGWFVTSAFTPAAHAQATAALTPLFSFAHDANGQRPKAGLLRASDGNFYGTTTPFYNPGTLFKLAPDGTFTSLHQFTLNLEPDSELIQTRDGSIYGTANGVGGVSPRHGGIFRMAPDGTVSVVYFFNTDNSFTGPTDPVNCGLTQASNGLLYGVTTFGGNSNGGDGTFYRLNADNTVTTLHRFVDATEGGGPVGRLVQATDGNFYGLTTTGGTGNRGTIFRLTPDGTLTVLHAFKYHATGTSQPDDGSSPTAGLIQGSDGYLYGTTSGGGGGLSSKGYPDGDHGTIFRISLAGEFTVMHSFLNYDGGGPGARLIQGADGNFYGNTGSGGQGDANGNGALGTVFQMTPDGTFTALHTFTGPDGGNPQGNLTQAADGSFYGTTISGITSDDMARYGNLFRFTVSGVPHPGFFHDEVALSNGVFFLQFPISPDAYQAFGYYSYLTDPHYIYHFDLGYEYVFPAADGHVGVYLYDFKSNGFFYTSPSFPFPYLYDFSLNTVLYYYPDPSNAGHYNTNGYRFFYRFDTGKIFTK